MAANPYNITADQINLPKSTTNVGQILGNITQLAMGILGGLAIIFLIYGGIQMAYSRGNAKNVERARETILYAAVGLALAISAYAIVGFILDKVK
jgi:threonine/homoserine/homoserine lactone efflux protein